ncbi:MAG: GerMN domain-containing protein [Bacillota bacterium]
MRRKIYLYMLICCFAVLLGTTGCLQNFVPQLFREKEQKKSIVAEEQKKPEQQEIVREELPPGVLRYQVYFLEEKSHNLLPVTVLQPWTEGVARAALERLIKGPTPAEEMRFGISSPLPPQTAIVGINIRGGLCRVDFSRAFLDYDPGMEREVLTSVVYTLLQFNTVNEVEIVVEGSPVEIFPGGTPGRGTFNMQHSLNLEVADNVGDLAAAQQLRLYFCTLLGENSIFYVPITRVVAEKGELVQTAVDELLKGPRPGSNLFSDLPPGTKLHNFSLQGGILLVDFSRELLQYQGGRSGEENIINQLVLTLTALPGVERVQILVEGEKLLLPHGTSLKTPLPPPLLYNQLK